MNLALDFGNSFTKLGIFERNNLIFFQSYKNLSVRNLHEVLKRFPIKTAIISSVVEDSAKIEKYLRRLYHVVEMKSDIPLPLENLYETPGTLGADRIAGIVGGYALFPKNNILVINAGTCITYDIAIANKGYLGGNITPGIDMQLKALHTFTQRLPLVKKQFSEDLLGKSTSSSILTGVMKGTVLEMEGFIKAYKKDYIALKVLLSGGDALMFETQLKTKIFAVPNLVLFGINKILTMNEPD
ncbi:MAG: type III pantothenate kinase [Chitinophagales bacterium]|nr:type III pantothenate kinase [Chitinophagales bacterium]